MKASLDTNVLIHLYSAGKQKLLFELFEDGVFIYEQIRSIELEKHGQAVLASIDHDINAGKIEMYGNEKLKELGVYRMFEEHVKETKILYEPGDMGEVYAISLAQTLGAYSLVTDDTKQGGPYMSLLQFEDDIMPFNFADIVILSYLAGEFDAQESVEVFNSINDSSNLGWSYKSQVAKFLRRFWTDPYQNREKQWLENYCKKSNVDFKKKIKELARVL